MWRLVFAMYVGSAVVGCVTIQHRVQFDSFPERFDAIQVVRVDGTVNGSPMKREFLASVRRDRGSVEMVLMDPFWQTALLKVAYEAGTCTVTPLVQGLSLPFRGEEIVDTARDVFHWKGRLDENGVAEFQTVRFLVKIHDVGGDGTCLLPRVMELQPRVTDAPRLTITTKEWTCR